MHTTQAAAAAGEAHADGSISTVSGFNAIADLTRARAMARRLAKVGAA